MSQLNILKGDEDGFRLDSYPTRIEAVIIMLRLTGSEQTALEKKIFITRFSDVPDWAGAYAGYAYASSITSGVSENEFGTDEPLTADQFAAFALRALGYDDANGDFDVDSAFKNLHMIKNHFRKG
ncbi:MAG: S-layer homology domain-containing protein [Clostridiales bacterium]|nr:MAG: S-layer homology domain-containing protein [Clostridiales bacterium]